MYIKSKTSICLKYVYVKKKTYTKWSISNKYFYMEEYRLNYDFTINLNSSDYNEIYVE